MLTGKAGVTSIISGEGERCRTDTEPTGTTSIPSLTLADLISFTISSFKVWISRSFILAFSWAVAEIVAAVVEVAVVDEAVVVGAVDGFGADDVGSESLFCASVLSLGLDGVLDEAVSLGEGTFSTAMMS